MMMSMKSIALFAAVLLGANSLPSLDVFPPTAECSVGAESYNLPCVAAHYPPDLHPPQRVHCAALVLHLSPGAESCSAVHLPPPSMSQNDDTTNPSCGTIVVVRRGGCSFADKAFAAWAAGYSGLVLVDHAASADTAGMPNELVAPNLLGLTIPPTFGADAAPPSVVLVAENSTAALMKAAGSSGDACSDNNASCESTLDSEHGSADRNSKCSDCFSVKWAASWGATDSASLYYDGVRLAKAQSYSEAADAHARAATAAPGFITPLYEQANALLREGALDSAEMATMVKRLGVLPLATPRDWHTLREAYLQMCLAAHARVFGSRRNSTTVSDAPSGSALEPSMQPQHKLIGWYVGPGLGMGNTAGYDVVRGPLAKFRNAVYWLKVQWQQKPWRRRTSHDNDVPKSMKAASITDVTSTATATANATSSTSPAPLPLVVVVTVATDEKPELESLRRAVAASALGPLVVLGKGRLYGTSGGTKLALMEEWLHAPPTSFSSAPAAPKSSDVHHDEAAGVNASSNPSFAELGLGDDTLVLFVDAYDVLVMPTATAPGWAAALERRFESFGARALISGETGCWPDPAIAPALPWPHFDRQPHFGALYRAPNSSDVAGAGTGENNEGNGSTSTSASTSGKDLSLYPEEVPFPYPNSGGYVGRAGYLRTMLRAVMDDVRAGHVAGGGTIGNADDQRWLQRHWLRNPHEVKVDVFGEVFLSLHRLQRAAAISTLGPAHALGRPTKPRNGWTTTGETGVKPPQRDISPRFAAAFLAWADASVKGESNSSDIVSDRSKMGPPVLWLDAGAGTSIAPLIVHGNGHGKRALRIISCQLGLHCHWNPNATASA